MTSSHAPATSRRAPGQSSIPGAYRGARTVGLCVSGMTYTSPEYVSTPGRPRSARTAGRESLPEHAHVIPEPTRLAEDSLAAFAVLRCLLGHHVVRVPAALITGALIQRDHAPNHRTGAESVARWPVMVSSCQRARLCRSRGRSVTGESWCTSPGSAHDANGWCRHGIRCEPPRAGPRMPARQRSRRLPGCSRACPARSGGC